MSLRQLFPVLLLSSLTLAAQAPTDPLNPVTREIFMKNWEQAARQLDRAENEGLCKEAVCLTLRARIAEGAGDSTQALAYARRAADLFGPGSGLKAGDYNEVGAILYRRGGRDAKTLKLAETAFRQGRRALPDGHQGRRLEHPLQPGDRAQGPGSDQGGQGDHGRSRSRRVADRSRHGDLGGFPAACREQVELAVKIDAMETEIYWVPGPWPGRLGIIPRPRGGDWLGDEVRSWRASGLCRRRAGGGVSRDREGCPEGRCRILQNSGSGCHSLRPDLLLPELISQGRYAIYKNRPGSGYAASLRGSTGELLW